MYDLMIRLFNLHILVYILLVQEEGTRDYFQVNIRIVQYKNITFYLPILYPHGSIIVIFTCLFCFIYNLLWMFCLIHFFNSYQMK